MLIIGSSDCRRLNPIALLYVSRKVAKRPIGKQHQAFLYIADQPRVIDLSARASFSQMSLNEDAKEDAFSHKLPNSFAPYLN
jgi:hypothetical protein